MHNIHDIVSYGGARGGNGNIAYKYNDKSVSDGWMELQISSLVTWCIYIVNNIVQYFNVCDS